MKVKQLSDVLKKMPLGTMGDLGLPKEVMSALLANIEKARQSAQDVFAHEIAKVLSKVDFQNMLDDVVKNYKIKLSAEIELEPKRKNKRKKGSK